jgi:hypothetical protein
VVTQRCRAAVVATISLGSGRCTDRNVQGTSKAVMQSRQSSIYADCAVATFKCQPFSLKE